MSNFVTWKIDEEVKIRMGDSAIESLPPKTVADVFHATLRKHGAANALHVKRNGEWQTLTFQQYYDKCAQFAKALIHLGLPRFSAVSIIGFNSPEWAITEIGTIFAGGVACGYLHDQLPERVRVHCQALGLGGRGVRRCQAAREVRRH
ncbi:hypothetical protein PINS_up008969 [Pythium insidiosum]|nr:hypothetical protein PINS_up008969 [Pythium insidiosum]